MSADIAIIGMSGVYAGARDVPSFWSNILNKVDAISEADAEWTGPYLDPASTANDRIYTNRGGFLKDLAVFNPAEFGIMPNAIDGGEPDQYLALRLARDALADAGYLDKDFDRTKAGVVLGRGTYVNRGYTTLMQHGLVIDQTLDLLRQLRPDLSPRELNELRTQLKDSAPPFTTEMAPGLVPNVVSGLICNRLNLMGPNYIIDAACASTLIATDVAMRDLASGRADLMVTGGIQAHTPPQIYMIFCQLGALSRGALRPFDANAGGTLLGEGAGLVVLKRLADAERDGDRIYAVIKGYGASSDGRAKGLLAPRKEGEVLAIQRAYADAGIDPRSVGLVEAHGTGIALGDQTEIQSLTEVFGGRQRHVPSVAIGSVKSMISHCIPAAGSASIIKTALALQHKVLPPTLCDEVNPALEIEKTPFYVNTETRPWIHGGAHPRRAGINSFGFGGVNAHLVLEEYAPADSVRLGLPQATPKLPANTELLCLAADDKAGLIEQIKTLLAEPDACSIAQLAARQAGCSGEHRLAMLISDQAELEKKLSTALGKLETADKAFKTRSGLHYGFGQLGGKLAVVFPGEGAQYPGMLKALAQAFPEARRWFDFLERSAADGRNYRPADALFAPPTALSDDKRRELEAHLFDMDLASESVFSASQALWQLLRACGLQADALLGHSTGENTALVAAGVIASEQPDSLLQLARGLNEVYTQLSQEDAIATGSLLTIGGLAAEQRDAVLAPFGDDIVVAMDNCPNQAVVFGQPDVIDQAHNALSQAGAICAELPFGRAYHTAGFAPVAEAFRRYYDGVPVNPPSVPVISCASMQAFPAEPDAIRDLACSQWAKPVRFRETIRSLYQQGYRVFLEIGPSANLTSFINDELSGESDVLALASNSRRQDDIKTFQSALAALFAAGVDLDLSVLYQGRRDASPEANQAPKGKPLSLAMPLLSLKQAPAMPETAAVNPSSSEDAPATTQQTQASPADPREQALQSHFQMMQEFLQSQQRVLSAMGGQAASHPAPAPAAKTASAAPAPLLTRIVQQTTDSLQAELSISTAREAYLADHRIGGRPSAQLDLQALAVVPFTFSMEMLAEAAGLLAPAGWVCSALNNVRGHRWLALDQADLNLKLQMQRAAESPVGVQRFSGRLLMAKAGKPDLPVFEAEVDFAPAYGTAPEPLSWQSPSAHPAQRNAGADLYSSGMFHGPRLQGVKAIRRWGARSIEAELEVLPTTNYLSDVAQPQLRIDPALLDAAGQLAGYWLSEKYDWGFNCFPFQLASYQQFAPLPPAGARVICHGDFTEHDDNLSFSVTWDLLDAKGQLIARASGWTDRKFSLPQRFYQYRLNPQQGFLSQAPQAADLPSGFVMRVMDYFDDDLMGQAWGIWMRVLAHMCLDQVERAQFYGLPETGPRREEWLMGRIAAKEAVRQWLHQHDQLALASADIRIEQDGRGAPRVRCAALEGRMPPSISISHSGRRAVAVAGDPQLRVGIDLQQPGEHQIGDIEQAGFSENERCLLPTEPAARARAVLAFWAAKEAVAKALGSGLGGKPKEFVITQAHLQPRDGKPALAQVQHGGADYTAQWLSSEQDELIALASSFQFSTQTPELAGIKE